MTQIQVVCIYAVMYMVPYALSYVYDMFYDVFIRHKRRE